MKKNYIQPAIEYTLLENSTAVMLGSSGIIFNPDPIDDSEND